MIEHKWIDKAECMPSMRVKKSLEESGRDYLESDFVLVWDGRKIDIAQVVFDESGLYWLDRLSEYVKVVSWMPLPTPPEHFY